MPSDESGGHPLPPILTSGDLRYHRPPSTMTERDMQNTIVEAAKRCGWLVYHTHDSRRSEKGFPDLVLVRPPMVLFMELKSAKGRLSAAQKQWIGAIWDCRGVAGTVCYPNDLDRILKYLTSPQPGNDLWRFGADSGADI